MRSVKEINLSDKSIEIIKNTNKQLLDLIIMDFANIKSWTAISIEYVIKEIAKAMNEYIHQKDILKEKIKFPICA